MNLEPTSLAGVFLVRPEAFEDERGFFTRTWTAEAMAAAGLDARLSQTSLAWNRTRGTLRGLHFQAEPYQEAKLVQCLRGAIHDVVVDVRPGSPTYLRWHAVRLEAGALEQLYVPAGCAHGYLTLAEDALVQYHITEAHSPSHARGLRWDDPALRVAWPFAPVQVNRRDREWPLLDPARNGGAP